MDMRSQTQLEDQVIEDFEGDHILDEAKSPPDASLWVMLCGVTCVALEDGTLIPTMDFYGEDVGYKASCIGCRKAAGL